jgi:hypothetical protein
MWQANNKQARAGRADRQAGRQGGQAGQGSVNSDVNLVVSLLFLLLHLLLLFTIFFVPITFGCPSMSPFFSMSAVFLQIIFVFNKPLGSLLLSSFASTFPPLTGGFSFTFQVLL